MVINCMCNIEMLRHSLLLLLENQPVRQFELNLYVSRKGIRLSDVRFTSFLGLINWTIFQLDMSVPDTLKEEADSLSTTGSLRTYYRQMYKDMTLSDNYFTTLIEYWRLRQNQIKAGAKNDNDNCCQASHCVLRSNHSVSLSQLRNPDRSHMILFFHVEAVRYMVMKERLIGVNPNPKTLKKLMPWGFMYGPHHKASILGEIRLYK